jgi:hypothetical protein
LPTHWDAFRDAAHDDLTGWEVAAAEAQVRPEPPLTGASDHSAVLPVAHLRASRQSTRNEVALRGGQGEHVAAFLQVMAIVSWVSVPAIS